MCQGHEVPDVRTSGKFSMFTHHFEILFDSCYCQMLLLKGCLHVEEMLRTCECVYSIGLCMFSHLVAQDLRISHTEAVFFEKEICKFFGIYFQPFNAAAANFLQMDDFVRICRMKKRKFSSIFLWGAWTHFENGFEYCLIECVLWHLPGLYN